MVVPDEQQARSDVGVPGTGAGQLWGALGIGHQLAAAVPAPAPVVERAGDFITLDAALGEISAEMTAVGVKYVQRTGGVGEDDQLGAERVDGVRPAVGELRDRAQAMPAAGVPVWQGSGVDLANAGGHVALH